jgi:YXWGXW repeat-containing protein
MTTKRFLCSLAVAALLTAALTPAVVAATRVYVSIAPPPLIVETRTVAPSPTHVWIGGYHRWDGSAYVWVPGHWVAPPRPHVRWVAGHWGHNHHGHYWVEGHWK